ncbi:hypothetical protein [Sphingopyxis sp. A083]|uniref:hypothetical protein n=1 Tax=Sphingopyxis sp. A083 TaxID=1759083 RepID=UPI000736F668|nr:hypothetical protein [Sphingopyxis sp. A083]KTE78444.1 hypothetical protein ATE59_00965 [Sphingopyxis sp. A083]
MTRESKWKGRAIAIEFWLLSALVAGSFIAGLNRYAVIPIVIDDAALATLKVSGRFHLSETDSFAARIASLFDLRVERKADAIHLRRR